MMHKIESVVLRWNCWPYGPYSPKAVTGHGFNSECLANAGLSVYTTAKWELYNFTMSIIKWWSGGVIGLPKDSQQVNHVENPEICIPKKT
jgi:hypothetical protein